MNVNELKIAIYGAGAMGTVLGALLTKGGLKNVDLITRNQAHVQGLKENGATILMVSHDIEFCAEYADRCAMFFDGDVVSCGEAKSFFAGNSFYTTTANRIVRQWNSDLVTWEEVATWVEQNTTQ